MEIKCKSWKVEDGEITGEYAVVMGSKEIATNRFNNEYGGEKIGFPSDVLQKAKELSSLIKESIENNFKGV